MPGAPTPIFNLRRRVQTQEALQRQTEALLRATSRRSPPVRNNAAEVWVAKTIEVTSYPTAPANVFGIVFCTASFTRSEGNQTPTYQVNSASVQDYALSLSGYVDEGTYVLVKRQRNGQYVIIGSLSSTLKQFCDFTLSAALAQTASSVAGAITSQYGQGEDHASTSITLLNRALHSGASPAYTYHGASGDTGCAVYTGTGTTWTIWDLECPHE